MKNQASYMWIDYKKSYDPVSHSWISKIIEVYKIDDTAWSLVKDPFAILEDQSIITIQQGMCDYSVDYV